MKISSGFVHFCSYLGFCEHSLLILYIDFELGETRRN